MVQSKNSQNDSIVESVAQQIKMVGESKNILNLGGPLISNILNKNNIPFSDIKPKLNLKLGDYINKLSNEKLWADELPNLKNKFDLIILHDLLEQAKEPKLLLENLSNFLSDTGSMVATVKNFLCINNIFKIFVGVTPQSNSNNYDLNSLNLFLSNENFIISELDRNQEKIGYDLNSDYNEYIFPPVILELLKKDPEFEVVSYVFRIMKKSVDPQAKIWSSTFPKNYFLEHLKNKIDYYETLETSIKDKDELIHGLQISLELTKSYVENVIKEKEEVIGGLDQSVKEDAEMIAGLDQSMKETKSYVEEVIKEKDAVIGGLEESVEKDVDMIAGLESSVEETKSYVEEVIKEKDNVIGGLEKSVEEDAEMIAGLESSVEEGAEMIAGLESSLAETKSYLETAIKEKDEYIKEFRRTIFGKTFDFFIKRDKRRKKRMTK